LAGTGNQRGHVIGVLALDRLVVISIDDPCRHLDMAQLIVGKMRLGRPHVLYVREEGFEACRGRRESRVLLRCALDIGSEDWALAHILHARWIGIRAKREQSCQALRMMDRDVETNNRSVTPS